jgi:hypothetical protein
VWIAWEWKRGLQERKDCFKALAHHSQPEFSPQQTPCFMDTTSTLYNCMFSYLFAIKKTLFLFFSFFHFLLILNYDDCLSDSQFSWTHFQLFSFVFWFSILMTHKLCNSHCQLVDATFCKLISKHSPTFMCSLLSFKIRWIRWRLITSWIFLMKMLQIQKFWA